METIIGLAVLIILGYLASYQFRKVFYKWKGFDQFLTSGFLFIFIGILLGPMFLSVLSRDVIRDLDPFIYLSLGWIGFIVGIQFEGRLLQHLPKRLIYLAQLESIVCAVVLFGALFTVLSFLSGYLKISSFDVWTSSIILTACGTISSSLTLHYYTQHHASVRKMLRPLEYMVSLQVFMPLLGLAVLFSFFHIDQSQGARLSGWIWMGMHVITGCVLGLMMFYLLRSRLLENERLLLILGGITFSAGVAGYLHISPIVVCFIAGIVFANMPGFNHVQMEVILKHAERPLYLIMLILAGSLWDMTSVSAWTMLPVYVAVRWAAKQTALVIVSKTEPELQFGMPHIGAVLAQGPLAIALVVGFEQRYMSAFLPHVVTAILAGAIVNELLAGKFLRKAFPDQDSKESQKAGFGSEGSSP